MLNPTFPPPPQITYHNLQTIFQHLHLLKGGGTGAAGAAGAVGVYGAPAAAGAWRSPQQPQQQQGGYGGGAGGAAPMNNANARGMEPCQAAVLHVVSDPSSGDQGVHINDICVRVAQQGYTRAQVEMSLQFLQNEAHAYTTCDDHHWKATA